MAKTWLEFKHEDAPCPVCGATAGQPCPADTPPEHRWKRNRAMSEFEKRHGAKLVFREGLIAEVQEVADELGVSVPDFIEAAVEARL